MVAQQFLNLQNGLMRVSKLLSSLLRESLHEDAATLQDALSEVHPEDIAAVLAEELTPDLAAKVVASLPIEQAAEVLERLPDELRINILAFFTPDASAEMLSEMSADDRADLVNELPAELRETILSELQKQKPDLAEETRILAAYSHDTAGGIMTTEFLRLSPGMSCRNAIDEVRRQARGLDTEQAYALYVVDGGKLVGVLSLRELVLGEPEASIAMYMTEAVVSVAAETDQEDVARTIAKYDLVAVPVVGPNGQMLGIVTVDDIVDVIIEDSDDELKRMSGHESARRATRGRSTSLTRTGWLIALLFFEELVAASTIELYEPEIAALLAFVLLAPPILALHARERSQRSSVEMRALVRGGLRMKHWPQVLWPELRVGALLGMLLASIVSFHTFIGGRDPSVETLLLRPLAAMSIVTIGSVVGTLVPFAVKRIARLVSITRRHAAGSLLEVAGFAVYLAATRASLNLVLYP